MLSVLPMRVALSKAKHIEVQPSPWPLPLTLTLTLTLTLILGTYLTLHRLSRDGGCHSLADVAAADA